MAEGSSGAGSGESVNVHFGANIEELTEKIGLIVETFEKAFAGISTILAGGALFKEVIESTDEMIDATRRMMAQTGMTAEAAQAWTQVLKNSDTTAEAFTSTLMHMQMRLNNNREAFDQYKITTRDAGGNLLAADEIFRNVITTLANMKVGADRNAASLQLLGRNARDIEPYMRAVQANQEEIAKKQAELGLVVTKTNILMKDAFHDMLGDVSMVFSGMAKAAATEVQPGLIELGHQFTELGPQLVEVTRNIMTVWTSMTDAMKAAVRSLLDVIKTVFGMIGVEVKKDIGEGSETGSAFKELNDFFKATALELRTLELAFKEFGELVKLVAKDIRSMWEMAKAVVTMGAPTPENFNKLKDRLHEIVEKSRDDNHEYKSNLEAMVAQHKLTVDKLNGVGGDDRRDKSAYNAVGATADSGSGHAVIKDKNADAMIKAREALAKALAAAELALLKDADAEQLRELDDANKLKTISTENYYARKAQLLHDDNAAEQKSIEQQKRAVEAEKPDSAVGKVVQQAKLAELQGKLNLLKQQNLEIDKDIARALDDQLEVERNKIALGGASGAEDKINKQIDAERALATFKLEHEQITQQQLSAMEAEWENRRYQAELSRLAVAQSQLHAQDVVGWEASWQAVEAAQRVHIANMQKNDLVLAKSEQQLTLAASQGVKSGFTSMFTDLMNGTVTIGQAFHNLGQTIRGVFTNLIAQRFAQKLFGPESGFGKAIDSVVDLVFVGVSKMIGIQVSGQQAQTAAVAEGAIERVAIESWAAVKSVAVSAWAAIQKIGAAAWEAAANVYAAVSEIPYVGWILAPAMAVAAGAAVLGFASKIASAEGGWWQVPNDTLTNIHKDEMVLPSQEAKGLRSMIQGGGQGGAPVHIHGKPDDTIKLRDLAGVLKQLGRNHVFVGSGR
jgi:hypothetical protein